MSYDSSPSERTILAVMPAPLLLHLAYDGILRRLALGDRHSGHLHTGDPDRKSSRAKASNFRH